MFVYYRIISKLHSIKSKVIVRSKFRAIKLKYAFEKVML